MRNSMMGSLRVLLGVAVLVPAFALARVTVASAQIAGPKILWALGGTADTANDSGHLAMGGLVVLDNKGGAKSLNLTIAYVQTNYYGNGGDFVCEVTNPQDLSYSLTNGELKLTLSQSDTCYQTVDPSQHFSNNGNSVIFTLYARGSKLRMVSTQASLRDGEGDTINSLALSGEMNPSGSGSSQATGVRFVSGGGGVFSSGDLFLGHMALAGLISLNPMTKKEKTGTAKSLDLTLTYYDPGYDNVVCHLTDPSDVSYTLDKGVGTLTLTVGSNDTCNLGNNHNSLSFDLYVAGASGRIVSTGANLLSSTGYPINPAVTADFSTPGGF